MGTRSDGKGRREPSPVDETALCQQPATTSADTTGTALAPLMGEALRLLAEGEAVQRAGDDGAISVAEYRRRTQALQQATLSLFQRVEAALQGGAARDGGTERLG